MIKYKRTFGLFLVMTCSLLYLFVSDVFAQQDPRARSHYHDSLMHLLKSQTGNESGYTMLRVSDYWMRLNNGSDSIAVPYAQKAYSIFQKSGNGFGMAWAKFEEGSAYVDLNKLDSALTILSAAKEIPISDTVKRKNELLGTIWNQISTVYDRQADFERSTDIAIHKALPYFEAVRNQSRINAVYSGVACTFLNLNEYGKAIFYFKKELLDNSFAKEETFYATDFSRLAYCLTKVNRPAEAKPYFDSAYTILKLSPPSYPWIKYYVFKGYWERQNARYKEAAQDYEQALRTGYKINSPKDVADVLFFKYDLLYVQKKYAEAKQTAYAINNFYITTRDTIAYNKLSIYKMLWEIEKAIGNYKISLNWLEKYSTLADTVNKREQSVKINKLVAGFQSEKKEKEILSLENKAKQQRLTINSNRLIMVALAGGLMISFLLLLVALITIRNKKKLTEQKEKLHRQALLQQESEQQLRISNAVLEGEEKERSRLSQELHDGLGGAITGIKLQLQGLNDENTEENPVVNNVIGQLTDAGNELRRIAHNMMPENLVRFGLDSALKDLCKRNSTPQTVIHYYSRNITPNIPANEQLMVYRIIQELLNNALKHAFASEILVECFQEEDHLYLIVEDNGIGHDKLLPGFSKGIGLKNIYNRIKFLHGDMQIDSNKDMGTSFRINVKVHAKNIAVKKENLSIK